MYQEVVSAPISIPLPPRQQYRPCRESITTGLKHPRNLGDAQSLARFSANSLIIPSVTATITPSPICAALPVTLICEWSATSVASPDPRQLHRDLGVGVALSPRLLRAGVHHGPMLGVVLLDDLGGPGVVHRHRAELDLDLGVRRPGRPSSRSPSLRERMARPARGRPSCSRPRRCGFWTVNELSNSIGISSPPRISVWPCRSCQARTSWDRRMPAFAIKTERARAPPPRRVTTW